MTTQERTISSATGRRAAAGVRERVLEGLPVRDRRIELAGVSTSVLEGGEGPPIVLLHGPGGYAAHWLRVLPDLVTTHCVIAPDLPGHGASEAAGGPPDAERVLAWLGELIESTCASPPALVGELIGGAIAARFAIDRGDRLRALVLVDALGLVPFRPAPEFGQALQAFLARPDEETHDLLWRRCAFDLDGLRGRMGESWERLRTYNLDRAGVPDLRPVQQGLMESFGIPAIPPEDLARISVPTTLIWGRHDLATPLAVAEAAAARHGWPLHVVEDAADAPAVEQPKAFLAALRKALGDPARSAAS